MIDTRVAFSSLVLPVFLHIEKKKKMFALNSSGDRRDVCIRITLHSVAKKRGGES